MPFKLFAHPLGVLADAAKEHEEPKALVPVVQELEYEVRGVRAYRKTVQIAELSYDEMIEGHRKMKLANPSKHEFPWEDTDDEDDEDLFHFGPPVKKNTKGRIGSCDDERISKTKTSALVDMFSRRLTDKEDKGKNEVELLSKDKEPFPEIEKIKSFDRTTAYSPVPMSVTTANTRPDSSISGKRGDVSDSMRIDFSSSAKKLGTKASTVFRRITKRNGLEHEPEYLPSYDLDPPATKVIRVNEIEKFKRIDQVERYAQLHRLHYWEMTGVAKDDTGKVIENYKPYVDPGDPMEDNLLHRERKARLRRYGLSGIPPMGGGAGEAPRSFSNGYFDGTRGRLKSSEGSQAERLDGTLDGDDIFGDTSHYPVNGFPIKSTLRQGNHKLRAAESFYTESHYTSHLDKDTQLQHSDDELYVSYSLEKPSPEEIRQRVRSYSFDSQESYLKDAKDKKVSRLSVFSQAGVASTAEKEDIMSDYERFMDEAKRETSALTIAEEIAKIKYAPYYKGKTRIERQKHKNASMLASGRAYTWDQTEAEEQALGQALILVPQTNGYRLHCSVSSSTARPSNDGPNSLTTVETAAPNTNVNTNALVAVTIPNTTIASPLPLPDGTVAAGHIYAGAIIPTAALKKEKGFSRALAKFHLTKKDKKKPLREESGLEFSLTPLSKILEQTSRDYEVCKNRIAELKATSEIVEGTRADYDECKRNLDNFMVNVYQPYLNGELAGQDAAGEDLKVVGVLSKRSDMWRAKMRDVGQELVVIENADENVDSGEGSEKHGGDFHGGFM